MTKDAARGSHDVARKVALRGKFALQAITTGPQLRKPNRMIQLPLCDHRQRAFGCETSQMLGLRCVAEDQIGPLAKRLARLDPALRAAR